VYDGLVDIDYDTGELKASVADKWTVSPDGKTVVFTLKKGVKFSNGEAVLPSNFKCAWERALRPELASEVAYHLYSIKGAQAVNDGKGKTLDSVVADDAKLTLTVKLDLAYSSFVAETQHTVFSPVPKAACSAGKDYEQGIMIGNGPFKMAEPWKHDQSIKLVRDDNYYGGINGHAAYLDGVDFRITKDTLAAYNLFESGTGDNAPIPAGRFKEAAAKYGSKGNERPTLSVQYYGFNWNDPSVGGYDNAKLRRAISMAIDRDQINNLIFDGTRAPATSFTPPGVPGYNKKTATISTKADVAGAKKLLAEWGRPLPKIKLRVNSVSANLLLANIIVANLKEIGIEVELDPRPSTGYFSDLANGNSHQFFRTGWVYDYAGYDNGMYPLWSTAAIGQDNSAKFSSAQFDKLVNAARSTSDSAKQAANYQAAEKILLDQAVAVPLIWGRWGQVTSKRVDGYPQGATGFVDYNEVSFK
jgi:oligopeptide transport system substrate-binding protein